MQVFIVLRIYHFDEDFQIKILIILAVQLVLLGSNCHERLIIKRAPLLITVNLISKAPTLLLSKMVN